MGSCDHDKCCGGKQCNESGHNHESCHEHECKHEEMLHYFLEIADCAWEEVLKEKIKEHIRATQDARLTEIARVVSEGNSQRWKRKMEKKQAICDFKNKLHSCFCHKCE